MRTLLLALVCLLAVATACSSAPTGGADGGHEVCAPGVQIACPCPGGGQGAQVCAADGESYGACMGCAGAEGGGDGGGACIMSGDMGCAANSECCQPSNISSQMICRSSQCVQCLVHGQACAEDAECCWPGDKCIVAKCTAGACTTVRPDPNCL